MKKTALTILLAVSSAVMSVAQTPYDAWLFSENNYEGTARSAAMGNAFTALGGDLGAVGINPAGSAVAGYSQLTLTPSLTFSANTAFGVPYDGNNLTYFQNRMVSRMTRMSIPNVGFTFNFDTGRKSGLKNVTIGFVANASNSWNEDVYAKGSNRETSFLAAAAWDAQKEIAWMNQHKAPGEPDFTSRDFLAENAYRYMNWKDVVGYRSGFFSSIDQEGKEFAGATEIAYQGGSHALAGEVDQSYGRSVSGNKYEYVFNIGANISDFVYLGFNLGINSLTYGYSHYFKESAVDMYDFENRFIDNDTGAEHVTYFDRAKYNYSYSAEGSGVFAKLGIIVTPGNGLRFGAAIQTPTATTIRTEWQEKGETRFADPSFDGDAASILGENEYRFNSPWRANFGLAYTLGKLAVVSADYEVAAFGGMRYKIDRLSMSDTEIEDYEIMNEDIRNMYGAAHHLRVGAEVKPISGLSVRAGYNMTTSAQTHELDLRTEEYYEIDRTYSHSVSAGLGFSSKRSFFADIACRYAIPVNEYIYPYTDYLESSGVLSPEILNRHSNIKVLLTLGWRF